MKRTIVVGRFRVPLSDEVVEDMSCVQQGIHLAPLEQRSTPVRRSDYEIPRTAWAYITGPGRP